MSTCWFFAVSGSLTEALSGPRVQPLPWGKGGRHTQDIFSQAFFICTENKPAHSPLFSSLDRILKNSLSCILAISNRKKICVTHLLMKKTERNENPFREDSYARISHNQQLVVCEGKQFPSSLLRISSQISREAACKSPIHFSCSMGMSITRQDGLYERQIQALETTHG